MMALTPKQESFCIAYIETGNASEAYRRSYSTGKMKPDTINNKAHELLKNGGITARVQEIRAPAVKKAEITLEQHLNDLKHLRDLAESAEKFGPAIAAEIARGKAAGLYVENLNVNVTDALAERLSRAKSRE